MTRLRTTLLACTLALLVLSACSSNDKKQASPATSAAPASTAPPTTTLRPVDTSFTGQNSAQFCALAKTYNDRFANVSAASTPAQMRSVAQDGRTAINQAVSAAPAEIKPDVQVIANAFTTLFNELEKVNFDATKLPPTAFSSLQTPEFQTASTRFQAYTTKVCGITG